MMAKHTCIWLKIYEHMDEENLLYRIICKIAQNPAVSYSLKFYMYQYKFFVG